MSKQVSEIMSRRIDQLMNARFLNKKDMAERLNMDYSTFWRKVNGKRNIDIPLLLRMADILGTSAGYLLGETDNPVQNYSNNTEQIENNACSPVNTGMLVYISPNGERFEAPPNEAGRIFIEQMRELIKRDEHSVSVPAF